MSNCHHQKPIRLYKYYPENLNSIKAIANNGFWCESPLRQNDLNDSLNKRFPVIEISEVGSLLLKSIQNGQYKVSNYLASLLGNPNEIGKLTRTFLLKTFGASSFCENNDNELLWSHYASQSSGFVIEYEFQPKHIAELNLKKIEYIEDSLDLKLDAIIKSVLNKSQADNEAALKYVMENLSVKSKKWQYENEWRIWSMHPGCYMRFETTMIKSLFFGLKCSEDYIITILQLVLLFNIQIEIKKMYYDDNGVIKFKNFLPEKTI